MITTFPTLDGETLNAVNTLGRWLAQDDYSAEPNVGRAGAIILAGNAAIPTIDAACRLAAESSLPLVISGGIGHSTTFLYSAIAQHPRYNTIPTTGRSEAAILADIAREFWNVPQERLHTETRSTNCGENAQYTRELMAQSGITPTSAIVVQDPTMMRRTLATFARVWRGEATAPRWIGYPGFVPEVVNGKRSLSYAGNSDGLWLPERYLALLLGEIPRLRDDEQGYGPNGRDFIEHVDIPPQVEAAWQAMIDDSRLTGLLRQRSML